MEVKRPNNTCGRDSLTAEMAYVHRSVQGLGFRVPKNDESFFWRVSMRRIITCWVPYWAFTSGRPLGSRVSVQGSGV